MVRGFFIGFGKDNFFGSSSFGVDLIPIYIKSTPNDEEPNNHCSISAPIKPKLYRNWRIETTAMVGTVLSEI